MAALGVARSVKEPCSHNIIGVVSRGVAHDGQLYALCIRRWLISASTADSLTAACHLHISKNVFFVTKHALLHLTCHGV